MRFQVRTKDEFLVPHGYGHDILLGEELQPSRIIALNLIDYLSDTIGVIEDWCRRRAPLSFGAVKRDMPETALFGSQQRYGLCDFVLTRNVHEGQRAERSFKQRDGIRRLWIEAVQSLAAGTRR